MLRKEGKRTKERKRRGKQHTLDKNTEKQRKGKEEESNKISG